MLLSPTQRLLNTPQFHYFAVSDTNEVRASQHILLARWRETSKCSQMCFPQDKTKCDRITFTNHLFNGNASIWEAISKSLDLLFHTLWARSLIWMRMIDKIGCENFICKSEGRYFAFFSATVLVPVNKSLLCNYKCAIMPNMYVCIGTFELI